MLLSVYARLVARNVTANITPQFVTKSLTSCMMLATGEGLVVYPVVVVKVEGIMCRALLDTGAGSSYASATLIEQLNRQPDHKVYKKIEMMMSATSQKIEMYKVNH